MNFDIEFEQEEDGRWIAEIAIENNLYLLHDDMDFSNIAKVHGNLKIY